MSAVDEAFVDLIRHDQQVVPLRDRGDCCQFVPVEDGPGRVVWVAQEDGLGSGRDCGLNLVGGDLEVVVVAGRDTHRNAARELDARRIRHEAGLVVDDFVAWIQDRAEAGVNRLGGANGDGQLANGVVGDAVSLLQVLGDQVAELQDPAVGGVVGLPVLEAVDGRPDDRLWRREVRLPDGQADHIAHLGQHVEESADSGRLDGADPLGQEGLGWSPRDWLRGREVRLTDGETDDVLHLRQHVEEAADAGGRHPSDTLR